MAKETVKAFYEALSQDESIQQVLKEKEAAYTSSADDREAIVNEVLIPVAEAAGFAFTVDDVKEYIQSKQEERELNEEELAAVAGGGDYGVCVMVGAGWAELCRVGGLALCFGPGVCP